MPAERQPGVDDNGGLKRLHFTVVTALILITRHQQVLCTDAVKFELLEGYGPDAMTPFPVW